MLTFLLVMVIAAVVMAFVLMPLLRDPVAPAGPDPQLIAARDRALLAKERKLDEIRELRADVASGKLTAGDGKVLERQLRAEAADLLHQLDAAEAAIVEAAPDAAEAIADSQDPAGELGPGGEPAAADPSTDVDGAPRAPTEALP